MLILTRKLRESVKVDGPCIVQVTSIRKGRVTLGFVAAPETKILRTELEDERGNGNEIVDFGDDISSPNTTTV